MARGVNKAIILGTLGQDPEVRYTANGTAVANFSVATNEVWKDKQGDQQERVEWHKIVIWGKLAEIAEKYLMKGKQVYLEGKIQTRKWTDNDGNDRWTTEINCSEMQMLGGGQGGGQRGNGNQYDQTPRDPQSGQPMDDNFDDIPF